LKGEAGIGIRIGYVVLMVWSAMAMAREMVYLGCDKFKKVNGKMG
jgi:hypothetical protein